MDFARAPARLREAHAEWNVTRHWESTPLVVTYRLVHPDGRARFLKLGDPSWHPRVVDEAARMRWAAAHLPVPTVLDAGGDGAVDWLLTEAMPGMDASAPAMLAAPEDTVRRLAEALRRFHDAPIAACPFDSRLDALLAQARDRTARGVAGPFHQEFAHLTPEEGLAILERERPPEDHLVICHGDYCFPNVMFEGGRLRGFLDLGELGVADRWWDLAIGTWSTNWNVGHGWEDTFLEAYGVAPDAERTRYYRLLYDYVS